MLMRVVCTEDKKLIYIGKVFVPFCIALYCFKEASVCLHNKMKSLVTDTDEYVSIGDQSVVSEVRVDDDCQKFNTTVERSFLCLWRFVTTGVYISR
jgi:hypothetical protein